MRKVMSVVSAALLLACCLLSVSVYAADSLEWTFDEMSGELRFSGKGVLSVSQKWTEWKEEAKHVVIEEGITAVGDKAFWKWTALETVEMASVKTVGFAAFDKCSSLCSVELGAVNTIGDAAFSNCTKLSNCILPETLSYIGTGAFSGDAALKVTLPKSVSYLGNLAFYNCRATCGLMIIPENVVYIGDKCFAGCPISSVVLMNHTLLQTQPYEPIQPGEGACVFGFGDCLESILVPNAELPIENLSLYGTDNPFAYDCSRLTVYSPAGSKTETFATGLGLSCTPLDELKSGDFFADGFVNTADVRALLYCVMTESEYSATQWYTGDVNRDGTCNTSDYRLILAQALLA